jgi:two-component system response regulator
MRATVDILVADDSDEDALMTLHALRRAAPELSALRVKDGDQALQFLFNTGGFAGRAPGVPRLVLLDVQMPRVDGLQALRAIREHSTTRDVPVVMMSSNTNPLIMEQAHALGANEYCIKPVDLDRYCSEVEAILERWFHAAGMQGEEANPDAP